MKIDHYHLKNIRKDCCRWTHDKTRKEEVVLTYSHNDRIENEKKKINWKDKCSSSVALNIPMSEKYPKCSFVVFTTPT